MVCSQPADALTGYSYAHPISAKIGFFSAESAAKHSPGWKSERSELWNPGLQSGVMLSPVRAKQVLTACPALTELIPYATLTQGFGRSAAFTLGFAMPRFQR
jgi:hypothetical protein